MCSLPLASLRSYIPQDAPHGDCNDNVLNPEEVQEWAAFDTNRIVGNISMVIARRAPYNDVLDGGTMPAGVSTVQRAVVGERAVIGHSLVNPEFTPDVEMCGEVGEEAEVGETDYAYQLATLRGMGPLVCVKGMRDTVTQSFTVAEDSLRKQIVQLMNADVRATLVNRSGLKLVVRHDKSYHQMHTGSTQDIDTSFDMDNIGLPTAPLNFKLLQYAGRIMREDLLVEGFESEDSEPLLRLVASQEMIDKLRDESEVRLDHRYLAAGSYSVGKKQLTRYRWEGPYRGFAFGVDPQALRFNEIDDEGNPVFLEPEAAVGVTRGRAARIRAAWANALYEVAVLVGANSFKRLVPETFNGAGGFRFPPQTYAGQLKFKVIEDNDCNVWGDFGRHFYQIGRAYRPQRPHHVMAIAYKRQPADFDLEEVSNWPDYSTATSL